MTKFIIVIKDKYIFVYDNVDRFQSDIDKCKKILTNDEFYHTVDRDVDNIDLYLSKIESDRVVVSDTDIELFL